ncbi:MAG: hypothetical protein ACK6DY_03415 [Acidobacteriota bacterium]|jgi:hypothetical protein
MRSDLVRRWLMVIALSACLVSAQEKRKTIYVDRMEGLTPFVEKALTDAELPFDFIEEEKRPELKAQLKKLHSAYGEILYKHKFGRSETHRLELRNVETDQVIAWHQFQLKDGDEAKKAAAAAFAAKVKAAMTKQAAS